MEHLLRIKDLQVSFSTYAGKIHAVRGISMHINRGEVLAVVGESGCGKSVTAQSILQLNPAPPCCIDAGNIIFDGDDLLTYGKKQMQAIRGKEIGMIFQDPMTSLDPTKTIGYQIAETLRRHENVSKGQARDRAAEMLGLVGIPNPERRLRQYPHEFSGGMRQRVMIASALICRPKLLIADEPTTALDVTIQAQILDLLMGIREETRTAILLITHDMGVVADVADRVNVMYAGLIVESGPVDDLFYRPQHPYTWGLMDSIPIPGSKTERLVPIDGTPPDLLKPPSGCPFSARCEHAMEICRDEMPHNFSLGEGHAARCWLLHPNAPKPERSRKRRGE